MKEFTIKKEEAGQSALKYLARLLPEAPMGLLRKSMRKKNVTLNGKKMEGKEKLAAGDVLAVWFADETLDKFMGAKAEVQEKCLPDFPKWIVYEDENLLVINKPAGILSQGDASGEPSLNDGLLSYLGNRVSSVKPSICNRLDRNTSGLVLAGKTISSLQTLNALIKDRSLHKIYFALVLGEVPESGILKGFLVKDHETNQGRYSEKKVPGAVPIETRYKRKAVYHREGITYSQVEVLLVTGRSHQIRIHFASIGHPLLGDKKYGNKESLAASRALSIHRQMLHAARLVFPKMEGEMGALAGKEFVASMPIDLGGLVISDR